MLASTSLLLFLWPKAVQYEFYLKNICSTHVLYDNIISYKAFWNHKPDVSNMQEKGSSILYTRFTFLSVRVHVIGAILVCLSITLVILKQA